MFLLSALALAACNRPTPTPKPLAYIRIELPQHTYQQFDSVQPYTFEYPTYAKVTPLDEKKLPNSVNIDFYTLNATVYLTHHVVKKNLNDYIADANNFVNKHIPRASGILDRAYEDPEHHVYGMFFDIQGTGVASPCQFYLTDNEKHFVRGSLYFNQAPNNDSLAPAIAFVKKDIEHLMLSWRWK